MSSTLPLELQTLQKMHAWEAFLASGGEMEVEPDGSESGAPSAE
jgi:hypothetical protein